MSLLFSPAIVGGVELKNRIVMSPMCMYSVTAEDGVVTPWHITHYASRAVGQAGLIILEATAVLPEGRISPRDLGIWDDSQVPGLTELVAAIHSSGAKAGIQLGHAGRKTMAADKGVAPSPLPFPDMPVPEELTAEGIAGVIDAFAAAARRAVLAGFDVVELHAAHGYLLSEFLSPLANHRQDHYGGSRENRFALLRQVIEAVKQEKPGALFVRISAEEYAPGGNTREDILYFAREMKASGVDLIDTSTGGVVLADIRYYPGYQVPYAADIRKETGIATGAVGLITTGTQAEEILAAGQSDLIFIGRSFLRDPYWPRTAAVELGHNIQAPAQYERGWHTRA
ncbi:NADPH dehydrogenase NamA [Paenibacillus sp. YN15]|uniref:NADPH dehydrogenase NamA n=1 Tax=Paenibacillus sp. YN15 TaxID=1742774 RepID=UPI000DCCC5E4|nr:NADPH dehydrogenase NamA [Paenibacillus sp. YN15]RAV05463.1 NADPH dehydrogenase NamA [Paenibacillus sp. YN15]